MSDQLPTIGNFPTTSNSYRKSLNRRKSKRAANVFAEMEKAAQTKKLVKDVLMRDPLRDKQRAKSMSEKTLTSAYNAILAAKYDNDGAKERARAATQRVKALQAGWNRWQRGKAETSPLLMRVRALLWWFCPQAVPDYPRGRFVAAEEEAAEKVRDYDALRSLCKIGLTLKEAQARTFRPTENIKCVDRLRAGKAIVYRQQVAA